MDEQRWATTMAELRFLDQEAAAAFEEAVGGFPQDSEIALGLRDFRAAHARHAAFIDDVIFNHIAAPELPDDVRTRLQEQVWRVTQSRGRPDELRALLDAEQRHLGRYEEASDERMPPEMADVVNQGLAEEREHVELLQRMVAELT